MMAETLYCFGDFQGRFRETTDAFEQAITHLRLSPNQQGVPLTIALLQTSLGWNYIRLGQFDKSRAAITAAKTIYTEQNEIPPPGFGTSPEAGMALLELVIGNYDEAIDWCHRSLTVYQERDDKFNVQIILYVLANIHFALGDYDLAWENGQSAYALTLEMGNGWMMAYIHIVLGDIARAQNEYETARQHYQASYDLKQALNDPEGMATALTHLAKLAWLQKDYAAAAKLYEQNLTIYRQIYDQGGLVRALQGMGETKQALGEWATAVAHYRHALQIAHQMGWEPLILAICTSIASYYQQVGQSQQAIELASLVYHHPATEQETKNQTQQLFGSNLHSSPRLDLAATIPTLLTDLTAPLPPRTPAPLSPSAPTLLDPLTPRELEVLHLIADGNSNRAIAEQLVITVGTVKSYTSQIYSKLGVSSRTQAVAQAREIGLIP
jgi:LuxR family maltose regulon positive regulatory protein